MKIVIAAARRTPVGSFLGAFADVSAVTLGTAVSGEVLQGIQGKDVADVLAGNASSLNDGAAMLPVCDADCAKTHDLQPLAEIVSYAYTGVDPALMGVGPWAAVPLAANRSYRASSSAKCCGIPQAFIWRNISGSATGLSGAWRRL